jgi:hypothetical protein
VGRSVEQIADWLAKLGLGQYAKVFADNDIDVSVLPHLRDKDLKDLGISLGHRRKIFAAINEGFAAVQPLAEADRAEEHVIQETPERRYVTVLFSDLVGSTALSTRLDPEDLRDVIAIYQRCVEETVRRFDGFVAKFLGDGVLVYFGYPEAHEDDPERAVRAGLELVAAVKVPSDPRAAGGASWHRDRLGCCRRPDRLRRFSGAFHRWQDPKPGSTAPRHRGSEYVRHC